MVVVTNLAAAGGAVAALLTVYLITKTLDVGMIGNGAIAALVAITAPSGYVEPWAGIVIGAVAGVIVVVGVLALDKVLDDPVGALPAHGLAGIWGTLSCGLFTVPALAKFNGVGQGGLFYTGSFHQLGAQAIAVGASFVTVFVLSFSLFWVIKEDRRPARLRARGAGGSGHQRARHVGIPRIVHASSRWRLPASGYADRQPARGAGVGVAGVASA